MSQSQNPYLELSVALREVTVRLEHLQADVTQFDEVRKVAAKVERIIGRMEVQFDNLTERQAELKAELKTISSDLNKKIATVEGGLLLDIEEAKKEVESIKKELKDNVDKAEERRLAGRKLWVGAIVAIVGSLLTAITAITVAYVKAPATPEEPTPSPAVRDAGALLRDGSSSNRETYRRAAQDRSRPGSPQAASKAASTP